MTGLQRNGTVPLLLFSFAYTDIPHVQACLAVIKEYQDLLEELHTRDSTGLDWSYQLRTFALPRSEKSIFQKDNYMLSKSSQAFSKLVLEQLEILQQFPSLISDD